MSAPELSTPVDGLAGDRLVFVDCETTGLDPARHQLTEVAWGVTVVDADGRCHHDPIRVVVPTHSLAHAHPTALEVSGYWTRIAGRPQRPLAAVLAEVATAAAEAALVGSNPSFDADFLAAGCRRVGVEPTWRHHTVDVGLLARAALGVPGRPLRLADAARALGVAYDGARHHGAAYDTQLARRVHDAAWAQLRHVAQLGGGRERA